MAMVVLSRTTFSLSRRLLSIALGAFLISSFVALAAPQTAKADGAVRFMQKVKKELLAAARTRSHGAFARAIRRHADVPRIAMSSLGTYARRLPKERRPAYYQGVKKFMARYFTDQAKSYKIVAADIHSPSVKDGNYYDVDSTVYLDSGWSYTVRWRLRKRNGLFKIVDTQVLGFWLTPFQRDLFEDYVRKAGGNVNALIWALNN